MYLYLSVMYSIVVPELFSLCLFFPKKSGPSNGMNEFMNACVCHMCDKRLKKKGGCLVVVDEW